MAGDSKADQPALASLITVMLYWQRRIRRRGRSASSHTQSERSRRDSSIDRLSFGEAAVDMGHSATRIRYSQRPVSGGTPTSAAARTDPDAFHTKVMLMSLTTREAWEDSQASAVSLAGRLARSSRAAA